MPAASAFDSEVWTDARGLIRFTSGPTNIFQSMTVQLYLAPRISAVQRFGDIQSTHVGSGEPRDRLLFQTVARRHHLHYRARRTGLIVMAIGAMFGALNTMYSAVSERSREIATMRALGFGAPSVVISFLFEALFVSFLGGVLGCLAVPAVERRHHRRNEL